jgi:hypothetical protein
MDMDRLFSSVTCLFHPARVFQDRRDRRENPEIDLYEYE